MKLSESSLNIIQVQQCRSLNGWQPVQIHSSSRQRVYTVWVNPWSGPEENICVCEGYIFTGHCKHQHKASEHICGWHELDGIEQTEQQRLDQVCPECGHATMWILENGPK